MNEVALNIERLYQAAQAKDAELAYLRHFYTEANFGPAHDDVVQMINDAYNKPLPEGY